jgi:serine/threonine protein kinase
MHRLILLAAVGGCAGIDSLRGTLPWIAPEIMKNPASVTEKADIYR